MTYSEFLSLGWNDYIESTPTSKKITNLLKERGEEIKNDHIAFRTFAHEKVGLPKYVEFFEKMGLVKKGDYFFKDKQLKAIHLEDKNGGPKVFISELLYKNFSSALINKIESLISKIPENVTVEELFRSKKFWNISHIEYSELLDESEYCAWLASMGFRVNHFTIDVNQLKTFKDLIELNEFLKSKGIVLNTSGGEIKGSKEVKLEQSSTMADIQEVVFTDGNYKVPTCYYEFAQRHFDEANKKFEGFVTNNANKIFESTNK